MTDDDIIGLYFNREENAIIATDEKYGGLCRHISGNLLYDKRDVEECVSDTYLSLWQCIPPNRPSMLQAYVAKVTRNTAINRLRKNTAQKRSIMTTVSFEELSSCIPDSAADIEIDNGGLSEVLYQFLMSLDSESRFIFMRRYWYYDSINEIASAFGLTKSNIKSKLFRLRNSLKNYLEKEYVK